MTYGVASRYADIFSRLTNPYALIILDYLFDNRRPYSTEELAKVAKTTESKVAAICDELVERNILEDDRSTDDVKYSAANYQYANFIEYMLNRIE